MVTNPNVNESSPEVAGEYRSTIDLPEQEVGRGDVSADRLLVQQDSDQEPSLTVVMPTLNEEAGVEECIDRIKTAIAEMGVVTEIIVSDSSTDRTPEIARENGAVVVEPNEGGYGNAYKYAFDHARGEYVAIGDADTTYDFEELPQLLELANRDDVDMAMGSRLNGEIKSGAMPALHQYVGNPLLTRFLNTFYDAGVSDAHSGFRVIDRDALEELELRTGGMEFASEMIMDAAAKDMTIEEMPITYYEREGEATLDSFQDGWRHVKFMLMNAPGYLFSAPAAVFTALGAVVMALSLFGAQLGSVSFGLPTMIGGSLFTIVGYQIWTLTMFSSAATNPIREPEDPVTGVVRDRFSLEQGASLGILTFLGGAGVLSYAIVAWTITGWAPVPSMTASLFASTVTVVGIQTVFCSFFLSMLESEKRAV
ncbi:glycosyltransferase [Halapricum sp. CBA1109]|uniref:glycosyltransferase family 2 protein n=1 Tax=Halapricum sp. CBA1109 TaxID=2668068 RepID=UPI0012F95768|nr:glycosyltransferase [Halapricum sp. CBA1109]MUV88583.1 glycosyltransferase [Halapricum sp. CBA1109]